ncbi:MAG: peptide ABC transporter substrate-binding protein [Anaerolineae bacterium]|nr:peptide ABC transporter substrate-binding protein [Anaerolineae bacterium]
MTRHILWQVILLIVSGLLVGLLLGYLAVNYTTVSRPGYGGTYVEGIVGAPRYLNPLLVGAHNEAERDVCALIFSGLTRLNARGEVVADLARSWEVSPDGLSYTFRLRPGARWHDGIPVTADDVLFTVGLLKDPEFPGPPEAAAEVWRTVEVEKVDSRTVRFVLSQPYAPFLDATTIGILPAHLLKGIRATELTETGFNLQPVGSGPFRLAELKVEGGVVVEVLLEPFPDYYLEAPYLGHVQLRFYPDQQAVLDAYAREEIEGIARLQAADLPRAVTLPGLNLFSAQTAEYGVVFLNMRRADLPFFQETEVRQALLYALDRQLIIDEALGGQAVVAHSPLIPGTWAYHDALPRYTYDPTKARELLDEAGWVPGEDGIRSKGGYRLAFTLLTSDETERLAVARKLVQQWAGIGVTVTLRSVSWTALREALEARDFEAVLTHVALPGDPDPYPFWHETQLESGQNYAGFVHRRASEVLEQARIETSAERRKALYFEFQEIFAREVPALLLYVPAYTYGVSEHIKDVQIGPLLAHPSDRFNSIERWWIVPRRVFVRIAEAADHGRD